MGHDLKTYIEAALTSGQSKVAIQTQLMNSGWSADLVNKTLDRYTGLDAQGLLIPAPKARFHHIIRDIFVYLLTIITLSLGVYALGDLLIRLIEKLLPDVLLAERYQSSPKSTHWFIAQLIVSLPIYFALARWTAADVRQHPEKRDTLVRKLMIYFILYVSATVGLADFIVVLYNFLNGELTLHFIFKAMVILGLAFGVFAYYFAEIRQDDAGLTINHNVEEDPNTALHGATRANARNRLAGLLTPLTAVVSAIAIVGGLFVTGGPSYARLIKLDEKRMSDLSHVSQTIHSYYTNEKHPPGDLDTLQHFIRQDLSNRYSMTILQDPETGKPYPYTVTGEDSYTLCATFATDSNQLEDNNRFRPSYSAGYEDYSSFADGHHPKGDHCYTFRLKAKF